MASLATHILPIFLALALVLGFVSRLPKIDLGHSPLFLRRRTLNWLPMGLTYAFLYMGRYNLTVSKNALGTLMTKAQFGTIFFWGTLVYGLAFALNGPLTDRLGGRFALLLASTGSAAMNALLGILTYGLTTGYEPIKPYIVPLYSALYAANMYFQSFGAVSIVKINAAWFHIRERGVFGGIFGILISLGIYFAFDGGQLVADYLGTTWIFCLPAIILAACALMDYFCVFDSPQATGLEDFDPEDAFFEGSGRIWPVVKNLVTNPVILTIALAEFCTGFLRNAVMHWYIIFARQTGAAQTFVAQNWGMLLCLAGIFGGAISGVLSDRFFQSRRGPVAALLYAGMLLGCGGMAAVLGTTALGWVVVLMSFCVIGVHGMLSGTASMDFGGRKNVGVAVGLIDGCVYLGTACQALVLGDLLPASEHSTASDWSIWPVLMAPLALLGLLASLWMWHAKPKTNAAEPVIELSKAA
jgi:MFS transporter, OPA family, glycerol-3-phosphate transporter